MTTNGNGFIKGIATAVLVLNMLAVLGATVWAFHNRDVDRIERTMEAGFDRIEVLVRKSK